MTIAIWLLGCTILFIILGVYFLRKQLKENKEPPPAEKNGNSASYFNSKQAVCKALKAER